MADQLIAERPMVKSPEEPKSPTQKFAEKPRKPMRQQEQQLIEKIDIETAKPASEPDKILQEIANKEDSGTLVSGEKGNAEQQLIEDADTLTLKDVEEIVSAEEACRFLNVIRVKEGTSSDNPEVSEVVDQLKPVLIDVLANEKFLKKVAFRDPSQQITVQDIQEVISLDSETAQRLSMLLNFNVDPKLLPSILKADFNGKRFPPEFVDALSGNAQLQEEFIHVLQDRSLYDALYYSRSMDDPRVISETVHFLFAKFEGFTSHLRDRLQQQGGSAEDISQVVTNFSSIFGLQAAYIRPDDVAKSLQGISAQIAQESAQSYFDLRNNVNSGEWGQYRAVLIPSKDYLRRHAEALQIGKYFTALYRNVDTIYKQFMPERYIESEKRRLVIKEPYDFHDSHPNKYSTDSLSESSCRYDPWGHNIVFGLAETAKRGGQAMFEQEVSEADIFIGRRLVVDTTIMAHEMTHGMYETQTHGEEYLEQIGEFNPFAKDEDSYFSTADHALAEGDAVLMEMVFSDILIQNPQLLHLDQKDIQDLQANKTRRLHSLRGEKSGYMEGTYKIFHKVYTEAAGPHSQRDVKRGLSAVKRFVEGIDRKKALATKRSDPEYLQVLQSGNPQKLREFFLVSQEVLAA